MLHITNRCKEPNLSWSTSTPADGQLKSCYTAHSAGDEDHTTETVRWEPNAIVTAPPLSFRVSSTPSTRTVAGEC